MAIYNVCFHDGIDVKNSTIDELVNETILLRSKSGRLSMSKDYKNIVAEITHHGDVNGDVNNEINSLSLSPGPGPTDRF